MVLRFITYLAPSIPEAFYRGLAALVSTRLGVDTELDVDARRSGPFPDGSDPFSRGEADVGFMCAPCYTDLCRLAPSPVELLVAPVYDDARNQGRPVYYSELVVRRSSPARSLEDLRGGRWAYNDRGSLSGYHAVLSLLRRRDLDPGFFGDSTASGSHSKSLELVATGEADVAAIDANVMALLSDERRDVLESVRVLTSLGPHPVQPVVVRPSLSTQLKGRLREALLELATEPEGAAHLRRYRVSRFVPPLADAYEPSSWA